VAYAQTLYSMITASANIRFNISNTDAGGTCGILLITSET